MVDFPPQPLTSHEHTIEELTVAISLAEKHLDDLKNQRELLAQEADEAAVEAIYPLEMTATKARELFGIADETVRRWADEGLVHVIQPGRRGPGGAAVYNGYDIARLASEGVIKGSRKHLRKKRQ